MVDEFRAVAEHVLASTSVVTYSSTRASEVATDRGEKRPRASEVALRL
jgi:hypothetical protein